MRLSLSSGGAGRQAVTAAGIAGRVAGLRGWRRWLLAIIAGAAGALCLSPLDISPALLVPMIVAVWLTDGRVRDAERWRGTFADGFLLGFGYHLVGFWWLGAAFLIDPDFTWAIPFGVIGVPALLAIFLGGGLMLARLLWLPGPARILALTLGLTAGEWLRGNYLFTGFPWNSFGMALGGNLVTAQAAALIGADGLTFVAVLLAAAPATLADTASGRYAGRWRVFAPTLAAMAGLAGLIGYGATRLAQPLPGDWPGVVIRIMQPGLRPDINFSYENRNGIVSHYLALSQQDDAAKHIRLADVTMLVWPESAFPFILADDPLQLERISAALPDRVTLVTGAAREVVMPATGGRAAHREYFNAIQTVGPAGQLPEGYDKVHLVPFGEYLPFDGLLRRLGLRNFVSVPGGFARGDARRALAVAGLPPASPLICYEAIFTGEVGIVDTKPAYLLNITNDGWFGLTSGPHQHFAQARLRTIEEGLPMVRGAATGISAILDAHGRSMGSLPLGAEGILDGSLPKAIAPPLFARIGEWPLLAVGIIGTLGLAIARMARI